MQRRYWLLSVLIICTCQLNAQYTQDSLRITLPQAEALFVKNNIQLLAQKYSIDSARAGLITAKLYDNPDLGFSSGFYNPESNKFFDYSNDNREIALQVSELIRTAGKRNKNMALAKTGIAISEYTFAELIRNLSYTLRNDFFTIYYLQDTQKAYDTEISSLEKTAAAFKDQVTKGNIATKDLLRIQSQLYTLQAELATLKNTIDDTQSEFKLLLRTKAMVYILPEIGQPPSLKGSQLSAVTYQSLVDSAYRNRDDLKIAGATVTYNQQNLALQKALAVPDLTVSAGYDRLGSYVQNYNSVGVGFSIPLFNRNQGNIKQAKIGIESARIQLQGMQDGVESQIANAYIGAVRAEKLLQSFDPVFEKNFTGLITEVSKNFEKRNLSILEFIDFYDSYKENIVQLNTLRFNWISQLEQINFATNTRIFNR